ncbi:MAG: phosphate ABC transporter permease subunit PstC [Gemmataceae bacterium]|nr:phosphate ABC transporter permease subunit PstC [Gemmataceae bacterium]
MAHSPGTPPTALAEGPQPRAFPFNIPNFGDRLFRGVCLSAGLLILALFALLVVVLVVKSWETITGLGLGFFTSTDWNPAEGMEDYGALAFVYGTVVTSAIALLIAVPLGVGTAAFLSEIAPLWLRKPVSFMVEMLAAIPSVVYGFWGLFVLAPALQPIITALGGPNTGGRGILPASLILAIMIVPYVTAVSYDVCQAVPKSQREAALALGATRWQMIWSAVLPYARPGIIGAAFLALGRAIGETMAVTMIIGNRAVIDWSAFARGDTIASVLANQYANPSSETHLSAMTELALVLLLVSVITNALARVLIYRVSARGGATQPAETLPGQILGTARRAVAWAAPLLILGCLTHWLLAGILHDPKYLPLDFLYRWGANPLLANVPVLAGLYVLLFWGGGAVVQFLARDPTRFYGAVNYLMTGVLGLCTTLTVFPLFFILTYLVVKGVDALNWEFFVNLPAPVNEPGGGMANALVGSAILVGLASLFAIPVGLLAAIYLAENRNSRVGSGIRFVGELLGGVPSIVIGIYIYTIVVKPMGVFGWAGAFALGIMMIPIVMRASEESLKLVPESIRQASYALGASQWQTVLRVIVPAALPAIITGVFLAIARIAGETAPLIFTAGYNSDFPSSPSDRVPSVPFFIWHYATSPYEDWQRQAWAAALVLLVLVLLLNFGIRFLTGKRVVLASQAD